MTRFDRGSSESSVSYDDLFFRNNLGDLVIVAVAVLETENHSMVVDHRKSIAYSCFQELVMDEYYKQINNTESATNTYFTLDGRRLNDKPATPGLYIINGKKVVIK